MTLVSLPQQARIKLKGLSHEDLTALYGFAARNGRQWRAKLVAKWDGSIHDAGWIRRMRNTFGTDLLPHVALSAIALAAAKRNPDNFPIPDIADDARAANKAFVKTDLKVGANHKRKGQHADESTMEFLRRVVENMGFETEGLLDHFKSVDAVLDYFGLWSDYDTEFWEGILECIGEGEDPAPARAFIAKHKLAKAWSEDVTEAVRRSKENS
jgi:hypothetical protein